jgi:hypothetical protein
MLQKSNIADIIIDNIASVFVLFFSVTATHHSGDSGFRRNDGCLLFHLPFFYLRFTL